MFVCWGSMLLWSCIIAKRLSAIQQWVYQPRNKTLKNFLNVFVYFICKQRFGNNLTKVANQEDIKISVPSLKCSR
jgi:hypothetical protein